MAVEALDIAGARQRAAAEARASFARAGARTEPERAVRDRRPALALSPLDEPCEAVFVNTGGGVAGGDSYRVELALERGRRVEATTTAAEKIYRSDGAPARIETAPYARAGRAISGCRRRRSCSRAPGSNARFESRWPPTPSSSLVETLVFGRLAMGETPHCRAARAIPGASGAAASSCSPTRPGSIRRARASTARRAARGAGGRHPHRRGARCRGAPARFAGGARRPGAEVEAGASAFDGLIVSRLVSASPSRLREAAIAAILALSGRQPPRLWR